MIAVSRAVRSSDGAARLFRWTLVILALLVAAALGGCEALNPSKRLARQDAKYALEVLDRAHEHGFPKGSFNVRAIHAAIEAKDPQASALLAAAVVDYARAQHGLSIPKAARPKAWGAAPAEYDAAVELEAALKRRDFRGWLDAQPPSSALYRTLQQAYVRSLAEPATPASAG